MTPYPQVPHVLIVEDDDADAELTKQAFVAARIPAIFTHVRDGLEAVMRLEAAQAGRFPKPTLVILDIALPHLDGMQVLAFLRDGAAYETTPVVVLSGGDSCVVHPSEGPPAIDVWAVKPGSFQDLIDEVRSWRALLDPAPRGRTSSVA